MATKEEIIARREVATERYILSTLPTLYISGRKDGASFLSDDGHGYVVTKTGAVLYLSGYKFDGVDDFLQLADSPAWDFGTGAFTIAMSLKWGAGGGWLINHGGNGYAVVDSPGWSLFGTPGAIGWRYYDATATLIDNLSFAWTDDTTLAHRLVISRDAALNMRFYQDGVLTDTHTSVADVTAYSGTLRIGVSHTADNGGFLDGALNKIVVIKGRGWTAPEAMDNYLATR